MLVTVREILGSDWTPSDQLEGNENLADGPLRHVIRGWDTSLRGRQRIPTSEVQELLWNVGTDAYALASDQFAYERGEALERAMEEIARERAHDEEPPEVKPAKGTSVLLDQYVEISKLIMARDAESYARRIPRDARREESERLQSLHETDISDWVREAVDALADLDWG